MGISFLCLAESISHSGVKMQYGNFTPEMARCVCRGVLRGGAFQGVSFKLYRANTGLVSLVLSATTESGETDTAKWMTVEQ